MNWIKNNWKGLLLLGVTTLVMAGLATVILLTRIKLATSATVRNLALAG